MNYSLRFSLYTVNSVPVFQWRAVENIKDKRVPVVRLFLSSLIPHPATEEQPVWRGSHWTLPVMTGNALKCASCPRKTRVSETPPPGLFHSACLPVLSSWGRDHSLKVVKCIFTSATLQPPQVNSWFCEEIKIWRSEDKTSGAEVSLWNYEVRDVGVQKGQLFVTDR